jgi:serine/threonine protein kinase
VLGMQRDDESLVMEAAKSHKVTVKRPLRSGGQKLVAVVTRINGDDAVLKVARLPGGAVGEALKRAQREASLLMRLSHPNLVKGLSVALEHGNPPYALSWLEEFLDGHDMRDLIGSAWPWDEVKAMAIGVAGALAVLHENNVIHRDLSAGNVRRLSSGEYKVLDPGLAKYLDLSGVTGVHQPGTPGFLSPEHVQLGTEPKYASDIFCAGILMWLALTGELPVSPEDPVVYFNRLSAAQVSSITFRRSDLYPNAAALVDRCLQRQSARRYFDGSELLAALEVL